MLHLSIIGAEFLFNDSKGDGAAKKGYNLNLIYTILSAFE